MKSVGFCFAVGLMVCLAANGVLAATYTAIDLNPSGFTGSQAYGISGNQQVGYGGGSATGDNAHALLWSGSATNYVDLNPSGFTQSIAQGVGGGQQVGYGHSLATRGNEHALLWNGSAASCVDLNPNGFTSSEARGTSGAQQVGYGSGSSTGSIDHALLWNGSATNYVDLNPSGFTFSLALGISGGQQVGYGWGSATGGNTHALLWNGSAASCVDLNPSGFGFAGSYAWGISGNQQVGYGMGSATGGNAHALLWNGSAENYVDLHQFLPTGFVESYANGIDSYGNIAGSAYDSSGNYHAIVWSVPEPTAPIADAGEDQVVFAAADDIAEVALDGSDSNDPDGHALTYKWTWIVDANTYEANGVSPTIQLPLGTHTIQLVVNNGFLNSRPDDVNITIIAPEPMPPTANAGEDQAVYAAFDGVAEVALDGADSNDPAGNELTYKWTWTIDANTYEANGVNPTIELPVGVHTVQLVVNNGIMDSQPDDVNITVIASLLAKLRMANINCRSGQSDVRACIELPYGIDENAVDFNEPFILWPGEIEATKQQISSGKILAFFDKAELANNILTDGLVEVSVEGKLKSGQYFCGTDSIRINH